MQSRRGFSNFLMPANPSPDYLEDAKSMQLPFNSERALSWNYLPPSEDYQPFLGPTDPKHLSLTVTFHSMEIFMWNRTALSVAVCI